MGRDATFHILSVVEGMVKLTSMATEDEKFEDLSKMLWTKHNLVRLEKNQDNRSSALSEKRKPSRASTASPWSVSKYLIQGNVLN